MSQSGGLSRREWLGTAGASLVAVRCAEPPANRLAACSATVIFVRHAEKAKAPADDPDLTDRGRARAKALAAMLASSGVTRLFATELVRTQSTLQPLAEQHGLQIERYAAREPGPFADKLAGLAGEVVVVAGHANTVPAMVAALGGELAGLDERKHFEDTDYDRVIVQTLHADAAKAPMRALRTLDLRLLLAPH